MDETVTVEWWCQASSIICCGIKSNFKIEVFLFVM
jgi:hypothetical protein